jgi:hypothetical protein
MTRTKKAETKVGNQAQPDVKPKTQDDIIQLLVQKIKSSLTTKDKTHSKFIQVNENFKKVGPGLSISGLSRLYKQEDKKNFVLVPEYNIAGPLEVVEKLLTELGSSFSDKKSQEFGVIGFDNYEKYVSLHTENKEPAQVSEPITHDKMSQYVQHIKTKKTKKEDNDTPKKKKAQRRKSPTGVEISESPRLKVDIIKELNFSSLVDLLRKLAGKQEGLDITKAVLSKEENGSLTLSGSKLFKIKAGSKSKRVLLDGHLRGLASEEEAPIALLLKEIGFSELEQKNHLVKFKTSQEEKRKKKKDEPKKAKKAAKKPVAKKEAKDAAKDTAKDAAKDAAKEETKKEVTTKAKTRDVKPRTSKD